MTPAQKAGVVIGQEYVVTGKATHRFNIGEVVTLKRDDKTRMPLFENSEGKSWYVSLDQIAPKAETGPKAGVLWGDAPEGATHYAMNDDYGYKWHKIEDKKLYWYDERRQFYIKYTYIFDTDKHNLSVFQFKEIPNTKKGTVVTAIQNKQEVAQLKEAIRRAELRLTRQGAKTGRLVERLEAMNERASETKAELKALKAKLADELVKPEFMKITDAKELVELMHNPALWKAGMRVVNRSDETTNITVGEKYTLTSDARMGHHVSIFFKGDNGSDRMRPAKHYQLVTTDLV